MTTKTQQTTIPATSNRKDEDMTTKTSHTTIPAAPGWYRCSPIFAGGEVVDIRHSPVIAWIVSVEESDGIAESLNTRAVVVAGDMVFPDGPEYLRRPNGSYVGPECDWGMTRDELLDCMQQYFFPSEGEKKS